MFWIHTFGHKETDMQQVNEPWLHLLPSAYRKLLHKLIFPPGSQRVSLKFSSCANAAAVIFTNNGGSGFPCD